jgi:hypothetical protein
LKAEYLPKRIWEPAAGRGAIAAVLRDAGHTVYADDLMDYGVPRTAVVPGRDFFEMCSPPRGCDCIVTNPPYKTAAQFVRHAIVLVPKVCMLMRLVFLEGVGRDDVLSKLTRVHVFRNRLPRMHRDGWDGPRTTSTIAFAWFVWERGSNGDVALRRITWEKEAA